MAEPPTIETPARPHPETLGEMVERAASREVLVRPRTILVIAATALGVLLVVWIFLQAWPVITWIVIAVLFAISLMPAVDFLERRGLPNLAAVSLVTFATLLAAGLIAWAVVPPLIDQTTKLIQALPGTVDDILKGKGPLGFLQRDYGLADKVRQALQDRTGSGVLGFSAPALGILRGILTVIVATVTIFFLVFFMMREGRAWVEATLDLLPAHSRPRWERIAAGVTRTIRGYVTGNLLISLIAAVVVYTTMMILGLNYALPVAVLVAILDLIPLVGATAACTVAGLAGLSKGLVAAIVVVVVLIVYQQVENHVLQPVIYGRTVQLSPLMVLVAVLIFGSIAGIIGALLAIPVAGSLQVIAREAIAVRRERLVARYGPDRGPP